MPTPDLSPAEQRVVAQLLRGLQNKQIARNLGLAVSTVNAHIRSMLYKYGARNRIELALLIQGKPEALKANLMAYERAVAAAVTFLREAGYTIQGPRT